ncbi:MAG: proline iminopeptidase [Cyclobacteriaceae bacterium]|jgi:proline iminopeptidase
MMKWMWFITAELQRISARLRLKIFSLNTTFAIVGWTVVLALLLGCMEKGIPAETFFTFENHQIWYHYNGEEDQTPLIILHGGPGMPSYYLELLKELSDSIPIIIYDQLGAGRSDIPDNDESYNVNYYVEELEALTNHLGLKSIYLMGHSWGGYLATAYYDKYGRKVDKLILASPLLDVNLWINDADSLKSLLPNAVKNTIDHYELLGDLDNDTYLAAVNVFYDKHFVRKSHRLVDSTFKYMGTRVYNYMWGNTEFNCSGTLKETSLLKSLTNIDIPVLLTGGEFDECPPTRLDFYASRMEHSSVRVIKGASHMSMVEKPEENRRVIFEFLKRGDK